jgi:hypothetical protein
MGSKDDLMNEMLMNHYYVENNEIQDDLMLIIPMMNMPLKENKIELLSLLFQILTFVLCSS